MSKRTFDEYSSNINDYYSIVGNCGRQENASGKFSDDRMQTESSDDFMVVNMLKEKVSSMDEDETTTSNLLNMEPHLPDFVHMMDSKKRKIDLESSIEQSLDSFEDLFFKAINNGDLDCLLLLLRQVPSDFDINMPNHIHPFKDQPALHIACNCGYTDFLKLLLEHFRSTLNINLENSKGSRSIHFAAYGGSLQILITLVGYVAQCSNFNQSTGKEFIFKGRNTEIYITSHNARVIHEFVNSKTNDENQRTPLIIATEKGNTDAVQFLLGLDKALREACPELKDATTVGTQGSYLPIHKAASRNNTEIIQLLLDHNPKSVNAKTSKRKYPLYFAVKRGATCIVEVLLKYGASTREYTPSGKKLLHIAAFINNLDICKLLVEQPDCDLDANTNDGHPRTALHLAAKKGHCEIISLLLSKGANVECVDYFGRYPIHVAASSGSIEATNMLACINGKDYINSKNSTGITCLHFACASGHTEMIPFLKSKGFNFREAKDDRCIRPIYVAAAQNQQNVVLELAKHYKKDINYINSQTGLSPLHIAIARDSFSAVEALIESGADIYQPSGSGMSAIALAKHKNNTRLQTILNRIIRSE